MPECGPGFPYALRLAHSEKGITWLSLYRTLAGSVLRYGACPSIGVAGDMLVLGMVVACAVPLAFGSKAIHLKMDTGIGAMPSGCTRGLLECASSQGCDE